jgi:hypothetical protein
MFLNGVEIILQDDKDTKLEEVTTLVKESDRTGLDKKDHLALIAAVTERKESTYFTPLSLPLSEAFNLYPEYASVSVQEVAQSYEG